MGERRKPGKGALKNGRAGDESKPLCFFLLRPESATRQKKPQTLRPNTKTFPRARADKKTRCLAERHDPPRRRSGQSRKGPRRRRPHQHAMGKKKAERGALEGLTRLCCLCNRASIQKVFSGPLGRAAAAPVGGREGEGGQERGRWLKSHFCKQEGGKEGRKEHCSWLPPCHT